MKKRDLKNVFIIVSILVYIIIYKQTIITKYLIYENIISPIFMIITSFITILLLGYKKERNKQKEKKCTNLIIYELIVYFLVTYGLGIFIGFLKNSYSLRITSIIHHIISPLIFIITSEIIRYVIIQANKDKKYPIILITIELIVLELLTSINAYKLGTLSGIFRMVASSLVPLTIKHTLMSYFSYNTSPKLPLIYRIIMDLYVYIIPIFPNYGEAFQTIISIVFNTIIYITINNLINEREYKEHDFKEKKFNLLESAYTALLIVIIGLASGLFKYSIVAVGSNSMQPTFNKGDALFIKQELNQEEIKEKDIVLYYSNNKIFIHRISRIVKEAENVYYYTKGDANNIEDDVKLEFKDLKGKVLVVIPYVGYPNVLISEYRSRNNGE